MGYYLGAFCSSLVFVALAERTFKRNKFKTGVLLSAVAIVIVCWLAGARADTVGTDVNTYAVPQYNYAVNVPNVFTYLKVSKIELFYAVLVFIASRFHGDVGLLLFLSQLLVVVPVYIVAYKKRNSMSMTCIIFVYYFLFYNVSLNLMRQMIACAFLLLAYVLYEEKHIKGSVLCAIVAFLFHTSAILAILLLLAFRYFSNGKYSMVKRVMVVLIIMFAIINIQGIADLLINRLGILPSKYYDRIVGGMQNNDISGFETALRGILVLVPVLLFSRTKRRDVSLKNYNFLSIIGYFFSFMSLIAQYLIRFSFFFEFFFLLTLPGAVRKVSNKQYDRLIMYAFMGIICLFYWHIIYIGWGWHGTMPYVFR